MFRGSLSPHNNDFRSISEIHQHEKYVNEDYSADISLLKVSVYYLYEFTTLSRAKFPYVLIDLRDWHK